MFGHVILRGEVQTALGLFEEVTNNPYDNSILIRKVVAEVGEVVGLLLAATRVKERPS